MSENYLNVKMITITIVMKKKILILLFLFFISSSMFAQLIQGRYEVLFVGFKQLGKDIEVLETKDVSMMLIDSLIILHNKNITSTYQYSHVIKKNDSYVYTCKQLDSELSIVFVYEPSDKLKNSGTLTHILNEQSVIVYAISLQNNRDATKNPIR